MTRALPAVFLLLGLLLGSSPSWAQGPEVAAPALPEPAQLTNLLERLRALEERVGRLDEENQRLREGVKKAQRPLLSVPDLSVSDGVKLRLTSYVDIGFFKAMGDGVSYVRDVGHTLRPDLASFPWVFLGDPWANTINSQGDSADLGLDRTNIARFDPIRSGGKASFIVNMVNLSLVSTLGQHLLAEASINFEPRQGNLGSPGDLFDVDLAYLEYTPKKNLDLHIFAGKLESTFGIEYRRRKAPARFGVTPTMMSRYTVGTPTGVKIRGGLFNLITYALAVTNGGMWTERFGHFYNETDRNNFKTLSLRLSIGRKLGAVDFEVGGSGVVGAQDLQAVESRYQWQAGCDLRLEVRDFSLRAEFLKVRADGGGVANAPQLDALGAYGEVTYQVLPWLGVLARVDWRDALLFSPPNVYVSNVLRVTGALRFDVHFNVIAKLEYVRVQELTGPEIDDDVVTSSLIFRL